MDKDTKMAWHDIAGRLASNEEGARSKALHFWLPPKTFLFTHLVFDFFWFAAMFTVYFKAGMGQTWKQKTLAPQGDMDLSILCVS